VYGRQAAFDATVQTLNAHNARTDNAAGTDNSLEISHLSVQIYTDNNTEHVSMLTESMALLNSYVMLACYLHTCRRELRHTAAGGNG